jgi:hypothetical protein
MGEAPQPRQHRREFIAKLRLAHLFALLVDETVGQARFIRD